ncbi:MAG: TatD family hydrolase [Mariniphaga sp.]|nr:TatD family hydrolase [Mariniphaga sp.]
MNQVVPYIDLHTHHAKPEESIITVRNLFPGESIPAFKGRNFFSVGLHPWEIKSEEENNEKLVMLEDALEFDHVIFVGECGLDKIIKTDFEEQKRVFRAQAFMAEEFKIPLIIHCVKAYNEVIELHKEMHPTVPWIFHGYSGNREISEQLIKKEMLFSFGKILFNKNAKALDSLRFLPPKSVFFETDEYSGNVEDIYSEAAEILDIHIDKLKEIVWENFNRIENVNL